jgi:hypothetical protein
MENFVCVKCKATENRYAKSLCRKCYNKIYSKDYYKLNKQKILDTNDKYYIEHKNECLKKMKEYQEKNKDNFSIYNQKYYLENKERMNAQMKVNYEKNKLKYKLAYQDRKKKRV